MAKTKRKHLAALETQKPLGHNDIKSDPMADACQALTSSIKQGCSQNPAAAEASLPSASPSPHKAGHKVEQNEALLLPSSPYFQPHGDDSDSDSWIHVRKQRVIIIIPPLPTAKPRFLKTNQQVANGGKDGFRCTQRKNRAKLHKDKVKGNVSNTDVYGKTRQDAIGTLETENNAERSISRCLRESICTGAPPISSMDILLASALDTDHTTPCQEKTCQHADTYSQQEASLDTADSSVQPRMSSLKERKVLKVPVRSNQVAQECIKKRRISLCKSAEPNMTRKRKKPQHATPLANGVLGHLLGPDIVDVKEKGLKHCGGDSPALSCNQAIGISMLKKHLEKAGGLKSWLCSVGLGQFKEAFEKRMWSERDLLQLQMDDLKRMGKGAVGPRRKLIWAINHLSHQLI